MIQSLYYIISTLAVPEASTSQYCSVDNLPSSFHTKGLLLPLSSYYATPEVKLPSKPTFTQKEVNKADILKEWNKFIEFHSENGPDADFDYKDFINYFEYRIQCSKLDSGFLQFIQDIKNTLAIAYQNYFNKNFFDDFPEAWNYNPTSKNSQTIKEIVERKRLIRDKEKIWTDFIQFVTQKNEFCQPTKYSLGNFYDYIKYINRASLYNKTKKPSKYLITAQSKKTLAKYNLLKGIN